MLSAPRVAVELDWVEAGTASGRWRVAFVVRNEGEESLRLESAWIPHGRFRGEGRLSLDAELDAGQARRLEFRVAAQEEPGTIVENAFLILRARRGSQGWRVFTRLRVEFDAAGIPRPVCELVTVATIGT